MKKKTPESPGSPVRPLSLANLDTALLRALPELVSDLDEFHRRKNEDLEFTHTFFSYSFLPTLQSALDRGVSDFCQRAFVLIEELVSGGDEEVATLLAEEFFEYGARCENWMDRATRYMGPQTLGIARQHSNVR